MRSPPSHIVHTLHALLGSDFALLWAGLFECPVSRMLYGFPIHSCSPSAVAQQLWEQRSPRSSSLCCSSNIVPSFLLCKGNRACKTILAAKYSLWACSWAMVLHAQVGFPWCVCFMWLCIELCFAPYIKIHIFMYIFICKYYFWEGKDGVCAIYCDCT